MSPLLRFTGLALLCILVFCLAGVLQTMWLKSRHFRRFAWPVDCGLHLRGRRLFGANKTLAGFVVMVPAVTLFFLAIGFLTEWIFPSLLEGSGWPRTSIDWVPLGLAAGLGYTLAELPNSFIKRQLGVAPGETPATPFGSKVALVVDQIDSVVGAVLAIDLLVPTHPIFWGTTFLLGFVCHWLFNLLLYKLGVKSRPA